MDLKGHVARRGSSSLNLTATEWNLLEFFLRHPGQTLNRDQILDYVWSFEREVKPTQVDVYVSYLRRKLDQPGVTNPIQTVRGFGYQLKAGSQ
jgi:DNA-binding response OmpR family regulator